MTASTWLTVGFLPRLASAAGEVPKVVFAQLQPGKTLEGGILGKHREDDRLLVDLVEDSALAALDELAWQDIRHNKRHGRHELTVVAGLARAGNDLAGSCCLDILWRELHHGQEILKREGLRGSRSWQGDQACGDPHQSPSASQSRHVPSSMPA